MWLETPWLTLRVTDISSVVKVLREHESKTGNRILLVVDNTFLSPYVSNPLTFGADVVIHSVTKYINGHSDVVMGVLATNDDELHKKFRFLQMLLVWFPAF